MKIDMSMVGQGRAYQNPADAVQAQSGTYHDMAADMTPEEKLPMSAFPMAPAPMPFMGVRRVGGSR